MSYSDEQFSLEDILEEVKRAGGQPAASASDADRLIDEILKEQGMQSAASTPAVNLIAAVPPPQKEETVAAKPVAPTFSVKIPEKEFRPASIPAPPKKEQKEAAPPIFERTAAHFPHTPLTEETYHPEGEQLVVPSAPENAYQQLKENRKKKIKDFVLLGEEDEVTPEEAETDNETVEDKVVEEFASLEDAPTVREDLKELSTSLAVRLIVLIVLSAINLYIVAANTFSFIPKPSVLDMTANPLLVTLAMTALLCLAVIIAHTTVLGGLLNFFKLKADGDSLPALAVLACLVESVVFLVFPDALETSGVHLYSLIALLGLVFNCIGKLLIVKRTTLNFKYVTADCDKYATTIIADEHLANDLTKGLLHNIPVTATNRKTAFLSDFLDMSFREDVYDALCRRLAPIIFAAAAVLGIGTYVVTKDPYITLTAVTAVFVICSSFFGLFAVNLPMLNAVKRMHRHGGMMIGYPAVEEFSDVNSATLQGHDLFPTGSVVLHGIKTFKGMRIDDAILDAASILVEANSILSDIFMQVIQGKPELLKKVDTIVYEDAMGITGWVDNRRVLIGSRELMLNHGIDVPSKDYEKRYYDNHNEVIYLSTSGELTAAFIVSLTPDETVAHVLRQMEHNDIFCIVKTVDSILTREKLAEVFEVETELFRVIPSRLHRAYDERHAPSEREESFLANNGTVYSYIRSLVAAKRLRARIMLGIVVLLTSIIIGFGLVTVFGLTNSLHKLGVLYLAGYQLIWLGIAWLIQKLRAI